MEIKTKEHKQKLKISKPFINFGLVHRGVQVCQNFVIESMTNEEIEWRLVEVRWEANMHFSIKKHSSHLNAIRGNFKKIGRKTKIIYKVNVNVSVLVQPF